MVRAAAAALALVVALPAFGAVPPRRAALKLESTSPLVVSGRNFGPRERVLLTYVADDDARHVGVRATKSGAFRAALRVRVGRCASFTVRAAGARGSRAVLQVERACENAKGPPKQAPRK